MLRRGDGTERLTRRPGGSAGLGPDQLRSLHHHAIEDGRVRGLELHLERLDRDCRLLFDVPLDLGRVRTWARRAASAAGRCAVRITVFDPLLGLANMSEDAVPQVLVTVRPTPATRAEPLRVRSAVHLRDLPEVKDIGLFGALRLRREARRSGYDDVLFTDGDSALLEGSTWNIGVVRDDRVV
nr:aminotransferase class IV [Streptomyces sp. NBRC 110035]